MKYAFIPALTALIATSRILAQDADILCAGGSRIVGRISAVESDRLLVTSDFLVQPAPLKLDKVLEISLPSASREPVGDHIATLVLTNGDIIRGALSGIDEKSITLDTNFAGRMVFRRTMVDALDVQDRPDILYSGPTGLDGWTLTDDDAWTAERGWLKASGVGGIARNLEKLPDQVRYAFDVSWRSQPRFRFIFASDDITASQPENCYELVCQGRYVQLHKRSARGRHVPMGQYANVPEFLNKERCRIEILFDRKTGSIRLIVDGRNAKDWIDAEAEDIHGGAGFHFTSQDPTPFRVSRIEVTSWDGVLDGKSPDQEDGMLDEEDTPPQEPQPAMDPSRIRLRNNDQLAGELTGILDGKMKVKAGFGDITLPVSRLRTFLLHTDEERKNYELGLWEEPILRNGDIRAWFPDGGCITFRLLSAADGKLTGDSQTFGQADFDLSAFSRVEFNIHRRDFQSLRESGDQW